MSPGVSPRERRVLAGGAAVIGFLLLVGRGIPAWRRWDAEVQASAAEMTAEAVQAEIAARALPALRDSAVARRARLVALAPAVLGGERLASAGAALASRVSGAGAGAGVRLGAVQVLQTDSAAPMAFTRVRVRGDATGDLPGILRFLQALEGGPELLSVREWSISQPDAGGPPERPESLRLEFMVEGLSAAPAAGERP